MVSFGVAVILILVLGWCWKRENALRDAKYGPPTAVEEVSQNEKGEPTTLPDYTDKENHNFRYVY